jgi:hypothetical protein
MDMRVALCLRGERHSGRFPGTFSDSGSESSMRAQALPPARDFHSRNAAATPMGMT